MKKFRESIKVKSITGFWFDSAVGVQSSQGGNKCKLVEKYATAEKKDNYARILRMLVTNQLSSDVDLFVALLDIYIVVKTI